MPELDTVQADSSLGSHLFNSPAHLASCRAILERIESVALPEHDSQGFIHSIMNDS